jgi:hypothetical protein
MFEFVTTLSKFLTKFDIFKLLIFSNFRIQGTDVRILYGIQTNKLILQVY